MNYSPSIPAIRPYSSPGALTKLDGRTREARLLREMRAELVAHVGGRPSATQAAMIEQLVQIKLRLAVMDRQFAQAGKQSEHDSRSYLAHANSYGRLLARLDGMQPARSAQPTIREVLTSRAAAR